MCRFRKKPCESSKEITAIWEMTISDIFLCLPVFCVNMQRNDFHTEKPGILGIPYPTAREWWGM